MGNVRDITVVEEAKRQRRMNRKLSKSILAFRQAVKYKRQHRRDMMNESKKYFENVNYLRMKINWTSSEKTQERRRARGCWMISANRILRFSLFAMSCQLPLRPRLFWLSERCQFNKKCSMIKCVFLLYSKPNLERDSSAKQRSTLKYTREEPRGLSEVSLSIVLRGNERKILVGIINFLRSIIKLWGEKLFFLSLLIWR